MSIPYGSSQRPAHSDGSIADERAALGVMADVLVVKERSLYSDHIYQRRASGRSSAPTIFHEATYADMDKDFHNIGIGIIRHNVVALTCKAEREINSGNSIDVDRAAIESDMSVLGRFLVTKKEADIASFKTPDLRNVLITAPYFHDGSQDTLWDVMDHYNKGDGLHNPYLDQDIQPLALSETEIDDVVAFLASLTSSQYTAQGVKELAKQRQLSRTNRPQRDTARAFGPKPTQPKPSRNCVEAKPGEKPK